MQWPIDGFLPLRYSFGLKVFSLLSKSEGDIVIAFVSLTVRPSVLYAISS